MRNPVMLAPILGFRCGRKCGASLHEAFFNFESYCLQMVSPTIAHGIGHNSMELRPLPASDAERVIIHQKIKME